VARKKSPQQKKAESLKKDRRNAYGENSKSSRKNIPRAKVATIAKRVELCARRRPRLGAP
jgi:hypothetical protein